MAQCTCSLSSFRWYYSLRLSAKWWPGWVDLGGWIHTEMVYPPTHTVTSPSANRTRRTATNLIETTALSVSLSQTAISNQVNVIVTLTVHSRPSWRRGRREIRRPETGARCRPTLSMPASVFCRVSTWGRDRPRRSGQRWERSQWRQQWTSWDPSSRSTPGRPSGRISTPAQMKFEVYSQQRVSRPDSE